jgi:hypothetical protein
LFYLGIAMGVTALIALVASGGMDGVLMTDDPFYRRKDIGSIPLVRLLFALSIVYSLIMAVPLAVAGRGIMSWQPWAKTLGMLLAAVNMLFFPIGTGVGIYALWVLTDETTEFLFNNSPAGGAKR